MALIVKDRVRETTTTTGTGTITLAGAVAGFQSFSVIGNANTTYYTIADPTSGAWEVGLGTYTSVGTTLSRDTVLASSNSNNLVNFGAGTKDVFVTYPADKSVLDGGSPSFTTITSTQGANFATSSGNVGIGTSSPIYKLDVNKGSAGNIARFTDGVAQTLVIQTPDTSGVLIKNDNNGYIAFSGSSERMRIDSSGNVGIGTSSPSYRLSVKQSGNTSTASLGITSSNSANDTFIGFGYDATSDTNRIFSSYVSTGAYKPITFWTTDTERMRIDSSGNVGIGATPGTNARLAVGGGGLTVGPSGFTADAALHITSSYGGFDRLTQINPASASKPALNLMASTNSGGSGLWFSWGVLSGVQKFRIEPGTSFSSDGGLTIDSSGNVGIGTSSPQTKLSIDSTGSITTAAATGVGLLQVNQAGVTTLAGTGGLEFKCSTFGSGYGSKIVAFDDGSLIFGTRANSATWSERMRIDSSGNVGIGTSSPKAVFETYGISNAPSLTAASGISAFTTNSTVRLILGGYTAAPYGFWLQTKDSQGAGGNGSGGAYPLLLNPIGGDVGIGTSSPTAKLDAATSINLGLNYLNIGYDAGGGAGWVSGYNITYSSGVKNVNTGALNGVFYASDGVRFYTNTSAAGGTAASERMRIDTSGNVGIGTSSPAANTRLTLSDTNSVKLQLTGGTDQNGLILNNNVSGTNQYYIGAGQNLLVGGDKGFLIYDVTNSRAKFFIDDGAAGETRVLGTTIATIYTNGSEKMRVASGGGVSIGNTATPPNGGLLLTINGRLETNGGTVYSYSIRDSTTASAANVYIDATNGFIQRSTSSRRYKTDIRDATHGLEKVMALRPVLYKGTGDLDSQRDWGGLIAEEVHEAGLTEFVMYRNENEPDGLAYGNMVALLVKAIQELKAEVDALKGN